MTIEETPDWSEGSMITSKRRDGNTTRLVDYYIQKFFTEAYGADIDLIDHHNSSRRLETNLSLLILKRVDARLANEHQIVEDTHYIVLRPNGPGRDKHTYAIRKIRI